MNGISNDAYRIEEQESTTTNEVLSENHNANDAKVGQSMSSNSKFNTFCSTYKKFIFAIILVVLNILVFTYFGFATSYYVNQDKICDKNCTIKWCDGYGMLIIVYTSVYLGLIYYQILKPYLQNPFNRGITIPTKKLMNNLLISKNSKYIIYLVLGVAFILFCYFETKNSTERLMSVVGMAVLIIIAVLCSKDRSKINIRTVLSGLIFQFLLGIFCIRWKVGRMIFDCIGNKVTAFLNYSSAGASFVYGDFLVNEKTVFAFRTLSVIYFVSFFISILYYIGAMQWVLIKMGWILQTILGTTVCESVNSAANIFLGMSESPLLIKPCLKNLTASEIHAIMSSGFATVSGSVLAAYVSFGAEASHLITASVISAPAALTFAKIMFPETEISQTSSDNIQFEESQDASILDAASNGANTATSLILGIIANLVAFVSFIAFANGILSWLGFLVGHDQLSLEGIFGTLFKPLAFILGVPWDESKYVGDLIGLKTIVNEFVAYKKLGEFKEMSLLSPRSEAIATYALCGFANPCSLGIMIGALGAMEPSKKMVITSVAIRAFVCGSIVCFMTACIAGFLMDEENL